MCPQRTLGHTGYLTLFDNDESISMDESIMVMEKGRDREMSMVATWMFALIVNIAVDRHDAINMFGKPPIRTNLARVKG